MAPGRADTEKRHDGLGPRIPGGDGIHGDPAGIHLLREPFAVIW
jgi:hypothetical protein